MDKQFKVKRGQVITSMAVPYPVTEHSTDDECIALLKKAPNAIKSFESFPSNWKEIVEKFEVEKKSAKKDAELTTDENDFTKFGIVKLRAKCEELGIEFTEEHKKAELVEMIQAKIDSETI